LLSLARALLVPGKKLAAYPLSFKMRNTLTALYDAVLES